MDVRNVVVKLMSHGPVTFNVFFEEDGLTTCKANPQCCSCRRSFATFEEVQVHAREQHPRSYMPYLNSSFFNCFACGGAFYPYDHYVNHFGFKISIHEEINYITPLQLQKIVAEYQVCDLLEKMSF